MTFSKIHPPVAQMPPMEIHPWLLTPQKMQDDHLYVFYRLDNNSLVATGFLLLDIVFNAFMIFVNRLPLCVS